MSRRDSRERDTTSSLVYGGVPRAHLMPPEVALRRREVGVRRALIAGILVVVLVVATGIAGSFWFAGQAEQGLTEERRTTEELLAIQLQYSEVSRVQAQSRLIEEQRAALLGGEVLWRETLDPYLAVIDGGVVDALSMRSNEPFSPPLAIEGPLRAPRVATVTLTVTTPNPPPAAQWLREFALVESYADASVSTVVADDEGFFTTITLNLSDAALSSRAHDEAEGES